MISAAILALWRARPGFVALRRAGGRHETDLWFNKPCLCSMITHVRILRVNLTVG